MVDKLDRPVPYVSSLQMFLLGSNKVRENTNTVLISEVRFSFHSHSLFSTGHFF